MVLKAFIDDSSRDDDVYVVAGHVATSETWAEFSREWEEMLELLPIQADGSRRFKMSEMVNAEDMWSVKAFAKLLNRSDIAVIGCGVCKTDVQNAQRSIYFPRFSPIEYSTGLDITSSKFWGNFKNIFMILIRTLVMGVNENRHMLEPAIPADQPIDYIFDDQTERRSVYAWWDDFVSNQPSEMRRLYGAMPRFEKEENFMPLQAADLKAWWFRERFSSVVNRPTNRSEEAKRQIEEMLSELKQHCNKVVYLIMNKENTSENMLNVAVDIFWRSRSYQVTYRWKS